MHRSALRLSRIWRRCLSTLLFDAPVGDVYRGDKAQDYLNARRKQHYWQLEQRVMHNILSTFPNGLAVLDMPFGTGRFVPYYLEKHMTVYGLDSSRDMLSIAQSELREAFDRCNVCIGDATQLPYGDGAFDMVVCFRFLSHVINCRQAKAVLREIHRVCKSHALLQFRIRNDDVRPVRRPFPFEPLNDRLTLSAHTRLLGNAGFTVSRCELLEQRDTYYRAVLVCDKR